ASTVLLVASRPINRPSQNFFPSASLPGRPYWPTRRPSILLMIPAATARMKQTNRSGTMILMGVNCTGSRPSGKKRLRIRRATGAIAMKIAMKMSRRQPARKPFGPMKIRFDVEAAGELGRIAMAFSSSHYVAPNSLVRNRLPQRFDVGGVGEKAGVVWVAFRRGDPPGFFGPGILRDWPLAAGLGLHPASV